MLWKARDTVGDHKAMAREASFGNPKTGHLSFLIESYTPKFYYFEVLDCVRRMLLTSAVGLFDEDTPNSAIAGVIISLIFTYVFTEMKPVGCHPKILCHLFTGCTTQWRGRPYCYLLILDLLYFVFGGQIPIKSTRFI